MKKRRLIWRIIMLAAMALSFLGMFLPWVRALGGAEAALPGVVLRRVFMVVTGLTFGVSVFFFLTRRTAWGLCYLLTQLFNLVLSFVVVSRANPEGGPALYGMTGWYGACVFLTATGILAFFMGLIRRNAGRSRAQGAADETVRRQEASDGRPGKKRGRTGLFGRRRPGKKNENQARGEAGASGLLEDQDAAEGEDDYAEALAIAEAAERQKKKEMAERDAGPEIGAAPAPSVPDFVTEARHQKLPSAAAASYREDAAAFFSDEAWASGEAETKVPYGSPSHHEDAAAFFSDEAWASGEAETIKPAPEVAFAAEAEEDAGEAPEAAAEPDVSAYFAPEDEEETADIEDEEDEVPEPEDFMDALGGFLDKFYALIKKGAAKAGKGIEAGASFVRDRRGKAAKASVSDEALGDGDTADETQAEALDGEERQDESAVSRTTDDIAAAIAGKAPETGKRIRVFGRVQRDEVSEEEEFLRKRRKKTSKKTGRKDVKAGFIPSPKVIIRGTAALVALLVVSITVFLLVRRFKLENINLEDYVVISSTGFEGYGRADVQVDREALVEAVAQALARKGQIRGGGNAVEAFRAFENYNTIMTQLTVSTNQKDHLSNGDVVTVSFAFDNEVLKKFGLKLAPESISHTVRGLRVVKQYSPFDSDLIVDFTGTEPYGQIALTWAGDYPLHFTKSQSDGLSNGDVVQVTAVLNEGYDAEALVTEYGIILTEDTREYTVSGLSNYIWEVGSLGESVFDALDGEARVIITEKAAGSYGKNENLSTCDYVGSAVLTGSEVTAVKNYLYMVYQLTYKRGEATFDYYYYVRFEDVILHMDGGYARGEVFEVPTGRHGLFGLLDNNDALRIDWLHAVVGFETVEALYEKKVAPLLTAYTIDTDLGIDGIPEEALTRTDSGDLAQLPGTYGNAEEAA